MKIIKTCITNPELIKVGQKCEVKMSTKWMEMTSNEPYIYLPGKIIDVNYGVYSKFPAVTVYIRKCAKRGNYWPIERLMILPNDIGKETKDNIEDYQTIIFK